MSQNGLLSTPNGLVKSEKMNNDITPKPVIERGASWSYNETRILLSLWGQDMVQRQLTNSKRTRHVWEKIAERIKEHGYERTPDQVRTRVFNMIAEYRRILKNPTVERKKKCIFFDALHKIYQAKDVGAVRAALTNYDDDLNLEPLDFTSTPDENQVGLDVNQYGESGGEMPENSGSDNEERSEIFSYAMSPSRVAFPLSMLNTPALSANGLNGSLLNGNGLNGNALGDLSSFNGNLMNMLAAKMLMEGTPGDENNGTENQKSGTRSYKRMRSENGSTHSVPNGINGNIPEVPVAVNGTTNGIDSSGNYSEASSVLIDRMFSHLNRETEVMREWVSLERERLNQELSRRREENEREERREKSFLQTLTKMQEQMFEFLAKHSEISASAVASVKSTYENGLSDGEKDLLGSENSTDDTQVEKMSEC